MRRAMTWLALVALLAGGCECGRPVSVGFDDDASTGAVGAPDAGDRFTVRDAGPQTPGCEHIDRLTSELPNPDPVFGRHLDLAVYGDRVLVIDVPDGPLIFSAGELGSPVSHLGTWESEEHFRGVTVAARWRDGAWDVIVDLIHPAFFALLRVHEDGRIDAIEQLLPDDRTFHWIELYPSAPDAFLILMRDYNALERFRVAEVRADGTFEILDIDPPPGAHLYWQLLPRPARDEALIVAHDRRLGDPPRVLRLRTGPLRIDGDWIEPEVPFGHRDFVDYTLHDTARGLVSTTFWAVYDGGYGPRVLDVRWLDESFRTTAQWSVETEVSGHVQVLDTPPVQDFVIALHDSADDGRNGTATVFHGRSSAPGHMSAITPIGRSRAYRPPLAWQREDGRWGLLSYTDRIEVAVLCEAP